MFFKMFDNYFEYKDIDDDIGNDEDENDDSWYSKGTTVQDVMSYVQMQGMIGSLDQKDMMLIQKFATSGHKSPDEVMEFAKDLVKKKSQHRNFEEYYMRRMRQHQSEKRKSEQPTKTKIELAETADDLEEAIKYYQDHKWYNDYAKGAVRKWIDRKLNENPGDKERAKLDKLKDKYL